MLQSSQTFLTTVAAQGRNWIDWLAAFSTVAVAIFAGVEIWLAGRQRRAEAKRVAQERADRRTAADARVSVLAFALQRQIRSWLASENVNRWVPWEREIRPDLPRAEDWMHTMLAEADASPEVQGTLRIALLSFYRAVDTFDRLTVLDNLDWQQKNTLVEARRSPEEELTTCAGALWYACASELNKADKEWLAWWAEHGPLAKTDRVGEKLRQELSE